MKIKPLAFLLFLTPLACAADPPAKLIVGKDTTLITSPLNADGTPDYLTYLNMELSKGVTAENNAAIPLLRALGQKSISDEKLRPLALKALNLDLPADGPYFTQFITFVHKYQGDLPKESPEKTADLDPLFRAMDVTAKTPWTAAQYPVFAKYLTANEVALGQITAASKLPRFYVPLISAQTPPTFIDAAFMFPFGGIRGVANALACRAMLRVSGNDLAGAHADLLTVHRLARLVAQQPFLLQELVAAAMDKLAANAELAILHSPNLTANQAGQIIGDLSALKELDGNDPATDEAEQFFLLNLLMQATQGNPNPAISAFTILYGSNLLLAPPTPKNELNQADWNIALCAINRRTEAANAAVNLVLVKDRHHALAALIKEQEAAQMPVAPYNLFSSATTMPSEEERKRNNEVYLKKISEFLSRRPNESVADFSGRIAIFFTPVEGYGEKAAALIDRNVATQRMTLIAAALALHHIEKKNFPTTLDGVAGYLPGKTVPLDPFTGQPFFYHPTSADGYVIYSAGDNGKDDDGHDATSTPKGDDIVIRIP